MTTQAICESRNTEKVVKLERIENLSKNVKDLHENGSLWGVYYDENENIVAEDIWQGLHPAYDK